MQGVFEGLPYEDKEKQARHLERVQSREEGTEFDARRQQLPLHLRDKVAYDIGPKMIAISTALTSFERPLCKDLDTKQQEIRRIQRKLDRSRRKTNPTNYHENKTIKKGTKHWKYSKNYRQLKNQLADLERKKTAIRKSNHGNLCHEILAYGNLVHTEKVSIKGWQKLWGRSIQHHAPCFNKRINSKSSICSRAGREDLDF
ncbi:MAG: hypothetical protein KA436_03965 [Oligoflexales bacterium]|nr:hypothetical protein [Oligoflexales bacterium]